jgi:hypothetical protein
MEAKEPVMTRSVVHTFARMFLFTAVFLISMMAGTILSAVFVKAAAL